MGAINDVIAIFPMPDSACVNGSELVSKYLGVGKWTKVPCVGKCNYAIQAIADMNQAINDYHQPRGETDYVAAYKQRIAKFTTYYNSTCAAAAAAVTDPGATNNPGTTPITVNPVTGDTVVPGIPTASTIPASSTNTTSSVQTTIMDKLKTVPKWVYWAGGGLLVLTVIIVVASRKSS